MFAGNLGASKVSDSGLSIQGFKVCSLVVSAILLARAPRPVSWLASEANYTSIEGSE